MFMKIKPKSWNEDLNSTSNLSTLMVKFKQENELGKGSKKVATVFGLEFTHKNKDTERI